MRSVWMCLLGLVAAAITVGVIGAVRLPFLFNGGARIPPELSAGAGATPPPYGEARWGPPLMGASPSPSTTGAW